MLSNLQGPARDKEKREKERSELRDLVSSNFELYISSINQYNSALMQGFTLFCQVGKNLHVLGQIEGVDLDMYKEIVLPRVLEQVKFGLSFCFTSIKT